jgi:hypothetical protein
MVNFLKACIKGKLRTISELGYYVLCWKKKNKTILVNSLNTIYEKTQEWKDICPKWEDWIAKSPMNITLKIFFDFM